jgi:hypothetical protein
MGLSNRAISSKAVIKNGLIIYGAEPNASVGPGYYSPHTHNSGMILHSYNVHAQQKTPVKPILDFPDLHRFYANHTTVGEISYSTSKVDMRRRNSESARNQRKIRSQSAPRRQKPEPVTEYVTSPLYERTKSQNSEEGEQRERKSRASRELIFTPNPYIS